VSQLGLDVLKVDGGLQGFDVLADERAEAHEVLWRSDAAKARGRRRTTLDADEAICPSPGGMRAGAVAKLASATGHDALGTTYPKGENIDDCSR
jgi:hypothetical protein